MSKLSDIVGAVLHDLTEAQHETNRYSVQLSKQYYDSSKLMRFFPVPNALMDEVEIGLRFAVDKDEVVQNTPSSPIPVSVSPSPSTLTKLAHALAAHLGSALGSALKGSRALMETDKGKKLVSALGTEQGTSALAGHVYPVLKRMFGNGWPPPAGARKWHLPFTNPDASGPENLLKEIEAAVERAIESDPDLKAALGDPKAAAQAVVKDVNAALKAEAGALVARLKALSAEKAKELSIGVIVAAERLATIPEGAVQSIRIKAKLKNYRWVIITDEGGTVDEKLVPDE